MRKTLLSAAMVALAAAAFPTDAAALTCPASMAGDVTRQYEVNTATACAWGDGNIAPNNDDFLGGGIDGSIGTIGTGWTNLGHDAADPGSATASTGMLTFNANGTWTLTGAVSGTEYAIGVKDGASPQWAVFLITGTSGTWNIFKESGSGRITADRTALSGITLYSRGGGGTGGGGTGGGGTGGGGAPEPASLALFGLGLLGAGYRLRRRVA